MPIDPVSGGGFGDAPGLTRTQPGTPTGFGESLTRLVEAVETTGAEANASVVSMVDGSADVHEAMIALQRADLTLQLAMQVRNKLVQAYQEVMRMPV